MSRKHKCPVNGCPQLVGSELLCCRKHWYLIPANLRVNVWREFRQGAGSDSHLMACAAAVEAVNELVGMEEEE